MACDGDAPSQERLRDALVAVERMRKLRHQRLSAKEDLASEDPLTSTAAAFNPGMQTTCKRVTNDKRKGVSPHY